MPTPRLRPATSPAPQAPHRRYTERGAVERANVPARWPWPSGGLYPGEPEACRRDARAFLGVAATFGLLVAVAFAFGLEGRAFQIVLLVTAAALPVHYALPLRLKGPALIAAAVVALGLVFGWPTAGAVAAGAVGLAVVCVLPLRWGVRVALVASIGAIAALARAGVVPTGLPALVWPVLASLTMFRVMLLLLELKHAPARPRLVDVLGYLFLLPNACFIHFPVVDPGAWRRGAFTAPIHETQRAGLAMILRGLTHLLLCRLVEGPLRVGPEQVSGPATLAAFLVTNYLLYLKVSGQFHVACGILHLFGHALPETHKRYLLASSFTDYWRRINIYWKDFMVRMVFHPVAFRLRRWPRPAGLAVATVAVFVVTWALHAYQAFWLRGSASLSLPDALFWGILGVLVLVNVQRDARTRKRTARVEPTRAARALALSLRAASTLATFATIAVLWALWSSESVGAFLALLRRGLVGGG